MALPSCCLGVKDIFRRVLIDRAFLQSAGSLEIKLGTPLFHYSITSLKVKASPHRPPDPALSAFRPLSCSDMVRDVNLQKKFREGFATKQWENAHELFPPPQGPACLSKLDHFRLSCLFPALKLKQEILREKEGHLVMNTEVSQDSILGQILESKQMSIISTEGLERVFLWKTNKSDFLCISSEESDGLRFLTAPDSASAPRLHPHRMTLITGHPCLPPGEVCTATDLTFWLLEDKHHFWFGNLS